MVADSRPVGRTQGHEAPRFIPKRFRLPRHLPLNPKQEISLVLLSSYNGTSLVGAYCQRYIVAALFPRANDENPAKLLDNKKGPLGYLIWLVA